MPHRHLQQPQMMYKIDNTDLASKAAAYVSAIDANSIFVEQRIENAYKDAWRQCEKHFGIMDYNDASKTDEKKRCTRCGKLRHVGNFYRNPRYSMRLDCYCKSCRKELRIRYIERKDAKVLRRDEH